MSISNYFVRKVATVTRELSLEKAIEEMRSHNVDDVVVIDDSSEIQKPVGILTSHDIIMKAFGKSTPAQDFTVEQLMTQNPIVCAEAIGVFETISLMNENNIKRIPVVDQKGSLIGIVTAADLFKVLSEELSGLTHKSNSYSWRSKSPISQTQMQYIE